MEATEEKETFQESLRRLGATVLFEKVLTSSDVNTQGRIVVPKSHAEQHFPAMPQNAVRVEVPANTTFDGPLNLKLRYWINNQSRMYLLEGTQDVQTKYKMAVGDVMVFARSATGQLVVGGRKPTKDDTSRRVYRKAHPTKKPLKDSTGADVTHYAMDSKSLLLEPLQDGVFRAMPSESGRSLSSVSSQEGTWIAVVDLAGELYQAFFSSKKAAEEALLAACGKVGAE